MTATCTVIISATGDRCGDQAVPASVREGIFGGTIAECSAHHIEVSSAADVSLVGSRVEIHWHSWAKVGVIVAERVKSVDIEFSPSRGAQPIIRSFPYDQFKLV